MSNWIPTNELRWVIREEFHGLSKILQQKWKHNEASYYGGRIVSEEWRDVPVVEEE